MDYNKVSITAKNYDGFPDIGDIQDITPVELNLNEELRQIFEEAHYIAGMFNDNTVRSAYIIIAMFISELSITYQLYNEFDFSFSAKDFKKSLIEDEKFLPSIFGKDVANNINSALACEVDISGITGKLDLDGENTSGKCKLSAIIDDKFRALSNEVDYSDNVYTALEKAYSLLEANGHSIIDAGNFLHSLIPLKDSSCTKFLEYFNIPPDRVLTILEEKYDIMTDCDLQSICTTLPSQIEGFCDILNNNYTAGCVCDILGRDVEINKFWIISSKKTRRNSVFIGKAGCGKTAIIEAITMSIVNGTCPEHFRDYKVISVNLASMISGCSLQGQFESKIVQLTNFIEEKKVILFFDEIHQIIGAGRNEYSNADFAGMLKPILARDKAIIVGATTNEEYDKYFSQDTAFKRRFEVIEVTEPKIENLKGMIKQKLISLSEFHNVGISNKVLDYLIVQACCFYPEVANPDKTISLCDSSMAVAKSKHKTELTREDIDAVNEKLISDFHSKNRLEKFVIAIHEASHYVASRLLPSTQMKIPIVLSIIFPENNGYDGGCLFETDKSIYTYDDGQYFKELMILLMAGRVAEEIFFGKITSGAQDDLNRITELARYMLISCGMDKKWGKNNLFNLSLMSDDPSDHLLISEKTKNILVSKIKKIVDEVYHDTVKLVKANQIVIQKIAIALSTQGMLTKKQLDYYFSKYIITTGNIKKK